MESAALTTAISNKVKLLTVDDHKLVRNGIIAMLNSQDEHISFDIDEAASGEEALSLVKRKDYDIVLLDYQLPKMNGNETLRQMLLYKPNQKTLVLSNYDEYLYISDIVKTGAMGYALKDIEPYELVKAICTVLSGEYYYSSKVATQFVNQHAFKADQRISNTKLYVYKNQSIRITKRELEVLSLSAQEMSSEAIANHLSVTKRTIDTHRQNLFNKFGVRSITGLVKKAMELKII